MRDRSGCRSVVLAGASLAVPGESGARKRRVAHLRRRSGPARATRRSTRSTRQLQEAARSPGGSRPTTSARGRSINLQSTPLMVNGVLLLDRRHAARRGRARCRDRRNAVDAQPRTRASAAGRPAAALGPRARVLDRRQGGANPLRHARLSADRARCEDRRPCPASARTASSI